MKIESGMSIATPMALKKPSLLAIAKPAAPQQPANAITPFFERRSRWFLSNRANAAEARSTAARYKRRLNKPHIAPAFDF